MTRTPNYLIVVAIVCLGLLGTSRSAYTATLTTPSIVTRTLSAALACMAWQPVGVCLWLRCTPFGCAVKASLKVGHYSPDLVVGVYNAAGDHPWREAGAVLRATERGAATGLLGSRVGTPSGAGVNRHKPGSRQNLIFLSLIHI